MNQKSHSDVASDPTTCGRESINSSTSTGADFYSEVIKSLILAVVVDMAPAQTHTKYFSANAASCSVKVSASPMLAKYWTGSDIIAACLVPTLLIQSSSVRISGLITVFDSDAPRHETA